MKRVTIEVWEVTNREMQAFVLVESTGALTSDYDFVWILATIKRVVTYRLTRSSHNRIKRTLGRTDEVYYPDGMHCVTYIGYEDE